MKQNKDKCLFGKLNHHWMIDGLGNGICRKCKKKRKFDTLAELNIDLSEKTKINPGMGKVSW